MRLARFGNELLRGLVEANQRTIAVAWPAYRRPARLPSRLRTRCWPLAGDPVLAAMGLKSVFLERAGLCCVARATMASSTTLFSNNRKVQRARPFGGLEQAEAISLASFSPSKIAARQASGAAFSSAPPRTFFHQLFAHPVNHRMGCFQRPDHPVVAPPFAGVRDIRLEQYAPFSSQALSLPDQRFQPSRSSALSLTTYFFTAISFPAMLASLASRWRQREQITKWFQIG